MSPRALIGRALRQLCPALRREIARQEQAARPMLVVPSRAAFAEITISGWGGGGAGGISSASVAYRAGQSS